MSYKLKARPKHNRTSGKWNIYVEKDGKEYPLGKMIGEGPLFKTKEYDSKKDAIEQINKIDELELKENK